MEIHSASMRNQSLPLCEVVRSISKFGNRVIIQGLFRIRLRVFRGLFGVRSESVRGLSWSVRAPFGVHSGFVRSVRGPFGFHPRSESVKGQGPVSQGPVFEFPIVVDWRGKFELVSSDLTLHLESFFAIFWRRSQLQKM